MTANHASPLTLEALSPCLSGKRQVIFRDIDAHFPQYLHASPPEPFSGMTSASTACAADRHDSETQAKAKRSCTSES